MCTETDTSHPEGFGEMCTNEGFGEMCTIEKKNKDSSSQKMHFLCHSLNVSR